MPHASEIPCVWTLVTGPLVEPVTLAEVKNQTRITDNNSDGVLSSYISVAREAAESYMGRGILTQTWKLVLDGFSNIIPLPMASPLQSVTTVQYYDTAGVLQTLATTYYGVDTVSRTGTVFLKPDQSWPAVQSERRDGAVIITYVVGWTVAASVPERIKQGIVQYVAALDQDRDGMDRGLDALAAAERCWSDRIWWTPPLWGCR